MLKPIAVIEVAPYCWSCGMSPGISFRDRPRLRDPAASTDHAIRAVNVLATAYEFETERARIS